MAKIGTWSTTPANNNATPPDGWPEGQAPSTVNDCAREMMAAVKTMANSMEYIDLGNTPSFLTATTFSMATADATNFEVGRRVKLFDATTLYGTIISVSAAQVQVRLDSGALTASLSSVALAIVKETNNSLPNSVWRRKNVIINGQMDIWQRSSTFSSVASGAYTADRFMWDQSSTSVLNVQRLERSAATANVPTLAQAGTFLVNSLGVSVSAIDAIIASADYACLTYKVEGYDWRQVAHKPLNLSFWCKTNKSGIYACSFRNAGASLSYVQNFTVSAVNTWVQFSIPVPEAPTTQTWDYSSGVGLQVSWTLAAGGNRQCAAGAWTTMDALATSSQVNFLSSAGNAFAITAVQLEEGIAATALEVRPYQQELESCKRYFQKFPESPNAVATMFGGGFDNLGGARFIAYIPEMRAAPTVTFGALANYVLNNGGSILPMSAMTASCVSRFQLLFDAFATTNLPGNITVHLQISAAAAAAISINAEL